MILQPNKEKFLQEFYLKHVHNKWMDEFMKVDEIYKNHKENIEENLTSTFNEICRKCIELQEKNLKGNIKYIYFSLLRSSFLEHKGEYRVDLYDENWFLDKEECSINIDLNFVFKPVFEQIENLKEYKKEYRKNITDMDIESMMLIEVDKYNILVVEFLKNMVEQFMKTPSYEEMKKVEDIMVLVGEYMDVSTIIYPPQK